MAWDISASVLNGQTLNPAEDTYHFGISFCDHGRKMFVLGNGSDTIYSYTLSKMYDPSSAIYDTGKSLSTGTESNPYGLAVSQDGHHLYFIGLTNKQISQYYMSIPYDLGTATPIRTLASSVANPFGIFFSIDGSKLYEVHNTIGEIKQTTLGTAWDISSGTGTVSKTGLTVTSMNALFISADGMHLYYSDNVGVIYEFDFASAWDITGITDTGRSFATGDAVFGIYFDDNGLTFITSRGSDIRGYNTIADIKAKAHLIMTTTLTSDLSKRERSFLFETVSTIEKGTIQYFNVIGKIEQPPKATKIIRRVQS